MHPGIAKTTQNGQEDKVTIQRKHTHGLKAQGWLDGQRHDVPPQPNHTHGLKTGGCQMIRNTT